MAFWSVGRGTIFPPLDNEDGVMGATCKKNYNLTVPTLEDLEDRYNFSMKEFSRQEECCSL